jgi:hypothetical protein
MPMTCVPPRRTRSGLTVALPLASAGEHTRGLIFATELPRQHLNVSFDRRHHREVAVARVTRLVAVVAIGIVVLAGCQRDEQRPQAPAAAPSTQEISPGTLGAGAKVSEPKGGVVLTMSGEIGTRNQGKKLALDISSLERMRMVRMETTEPFLKRKVTFEGVLLSDLLAVAGVTDSVSKVNMTALDDYKVDFTVADVRSSQMLLATKADGKRMPVDKAGPIRIVFPDSSSLGRNPDLWIWSVSTMRLS